MNRVKQVLRRSERGATAVVVAFSMVFIFAAGALGMDIAKLAYARQQVRAAIDAAAQAGAYALPDASAAFTEAVTFAAANSGGLDAPIVLTSANVKFYCVVAALSTGGADMSQVPMMCNPGTAGVDYVSANIKCNDSVCAIPCKSTKTCNMISVSKDLTVDYNFAPAIGINTGDTGAQTSASCRGACGQVAPNPLDVVVMADRTYSMSSTAVSNMQSGIRAMLKTMTREQQYVAFGAVHKSITVSGCLTDTQSNYKDPWTSSTAVRYDSRNKYYYPTGRATFEGSWVPVPFSNNYTTGSATDGTLILNESSSLVDSIDCLKRRDNGIGTHLASAMKGAGRYLLGKQANNLASLPDRTATYGVAKKVIIFETDGRPEEIFDHDDSTDLSLDNTYDIGNEDYEDACDNLVSVAASVKDKDVTIIAIGYGNVNTMTCSGYSNGTKVRDVLAAAASPKNGVDSTARDCTKEADKTAENSDGDYYFCAASATDLQSVFAAAMGSVTGNTKFLKINGVGD